MDNVIAYNPRIFQDELSWIKDIKFRQFVAKCLEDAPSFFWSMPASTTGKYHPSYSLGNGGLVRHTKAACLIAHDLLQLQQNQELAEASDEIIGALILHDVHKKENELSQWTAFNHPILASRFVYKKAVALRLDEDPDEKYKIEFMCELIESHMGQWNEDHKGVKQMPLPKTPEAEFVHMCDYLASRKTIEVKL